jgi:hypothetical protein
MAQEKRRRAARRPDQALDSCVRGVRLSATPCPQNVGQVQVRQMTVQAQVLSVIAVLAPLFAWIGSGVV